ncbi:uncharacterized protein LOC117108441 [Anneissia japonica]|uniref:uncharacterized protein LOC117108441 n=1 Tax=Anneissia japonica TaxID=1529436 RepID=UPI00142578D5|nr:uncharacterized protein LOC117108441 [Anneissia japonica]
MIIVHFVAADDEGDMMGLFRQDAVTAGDESGSLEEIIQDIPIGPSSAVVSKKSHKVTKKRDYSTRQPWTVEEKTAVLEYFKDHIWSGVTPNKTQVEEAQKMFPILIQRSWSNIKDFVIAERRRLIKKLQK